MAHTSINFQGLLEAKSSFEQLLSDPEILSQTAQETFADFDEDEVNELQEVLKRLRGHAKEVDAVLDWALKSKGSMPFRPKEDILTKYDSNNDGKISKEEFLPFVTDAFKELLDCVNIMIEMGRLSSTEFDQEFQKMVEQAFFRDFDKDGSGQLDKKEVKLGLEKFLAMRGYPSCSARDDLVDAMFKKYDVDGDGVITIKEMTPWLREYIQTECGMVVIHDAGILTGQFV